MLFGRNRKKCVYDREYLRPVFRSSICVGEQVAGFRNIHTGKFSEVMLIRNVGDLKEFQEEYDISEADIATEY